MNHIAKRIIFGVGTALLVAIPAVATPIYHQYETLIKGYMLPKNVAVSEEEKTAQMESGNALAKQAVADGIVMLKNDGTLPLKKTTDSSVAVLGYHSVAWLYGGSGSGQVTKNPDDSGFTDLIGSLQNYGIEVDTALQDYYRGVHKPKCNPAGNPNIGTLNFHRDDAGMSDFDLHDPKIEGEYEDLLYDAADANDTAIVVLGRQGGESEDMPEIQYKRLGGSQVIDEKRHDLQISEEEEELLKFAADNFKKVVVVINSTNLFQMDFLEKINGLGAALYIGPTGCQGADAIAKVLYGDGISPSGHLADILPYDFKENVHANYTGYQGVSFFSNTTNYGRNQTTNAGVKVRPSLPYVDYVEGVYLGYRYYETGDAMDIFKDKTRTLLDGTTAKGYDAVVQFPFGYGLSYTTFSWDVVETKTPAAPLTADSEFEFQVIVKNTGDLPGKDVVELYLNQPYTEGGIEKPATKLVDFEKTGLLQPGDTELVTLKATVRDLASYDCYDLNGNGRATYEADKGTYTFRLATDSHHTKDVVKAATDFTLGEALILDHDRKTNKEIRNLFTGEDAVDGRAVDGLDVEGWNINYISRKAFPVGAIPQSSTHDMSTGRAMDDETIALTLFGGSNGADATKFNNWLAEEEDGLGREVDDGADFNFGSSNSNIRLFDADGKTLTEEGIQLALDWDDEMWNDVLGQIPYAAALTLVNDAHPNTKGISQIGYPATTSLDGPAQIGSFNAASTYIGVGFPCDAMLAQTWNKDLLFEVGLEMGNQIASHGVYGVYGCGMNLHRDPFGGRNYEYFSEDPFLAGSLAANYCKGVKVVGSLPVLKHFVAAETETSRDSLYTYMSEQTLRELYLEPFRMAVEGDGLCKGAADYKEGGEGYQPLCNSLMTSYNRIGAVWAGGSLALMQGVLFEEWGFHGEIITDWSDNNQYMHLDQTMTVGGNLGMSVSLKFNWNQGRAKATLRDAVKNVVYANLRTKLAKADFDTHPYAGRKSSSATASESFNWVDPAVIAFNVVFYVGAAAMFYFGVLLHPGIKFRKKEQ